MRSLSEQRTLGILIITGILGFRVGMIGFPGWQVAVETAQVVAGVVKYPDGNPFYIYHTKLWTLLHQVLALPLWAGASETTLSRLVSGLLGMVSFQALSMFVYALSRDMLLAVGAAFLVFLSRTAEFGAVYPIWLMGSPDTYGILGLSTIVLTAALFGAGRWRAGGFLLGLAPSVHPSLGLWLGVLVVVSLAWDFKSMREAFRPGLKYFLVGSALTGLSLCLQLALTYDAPPIETGAAARYLVAFVSFWDAHRQPIASDNLGFRLNLGVLLLALIYLRGYRDQLGQAPAFLLRLVVVSATLSVVLVFVTWLPPERLGSTFQMLMPLRVLNFNAMIAAPLLLGLAGQNHRSILGRALTLGLVTGLLLADRSMLWDRLAESGRPDWPIRPNPLFVFEAAAAILAAMAMYRTVRRRMDPAQPDAQPAASLFIGAPGNGARGAATVVLRLATLVVLVYAGSVTWRMSAPTLAIFRDRTNEPLFSVAARGKGLLLTGANLHLIQLRTRRPVLLDGGGLDGLPYSIEAAPAMHRILLDVYGIDLFRPPAEARGSGVVPHRANQAVWERYSRERWQEVKRTYDVTQVLTYNTWSLDLPVAAQNRELRLYDIPD